MTATLILLALTACFVDSDVDGDGDGVFASEDCDDSDAEINPSAEEVCDGVDNNCDGEVDLDAVDASTWYPDADGDGYGDSSLPTLACQASGTLISDGSDCDDSTADVSPDALEYCDSLDNNCDGAVDEDSAQDAITYYLDSDGDGIGLSDVVTQSCSLPSGYAEVGGDCDDSNPKLGSCVCTVTGVDAPVTTVTSGATQGQWMSDPLETLGAGLVWEMDGYGGSTLVEYASKDRLAAGKVSSSITLPQAYDGTGAVVYDGFLYYNQANSNTLVEYDIAAGAINSTLQLSDAGFRNTYPYHWGGYSDIDFAADENGLWVTYATSANAGRLVLSSLGTQPLVLEDTWNTDSPEKSSVCNSFVVCGVLYASNECHEATGTIFYAYDTITETSSSPGIAISQSGYNSMLDYNPGEGVLYSWDWSVHKTYAVKY
jgi:hypothetical protein